MKYIIIISLITISNCNIFAQDVSLFVNRQWTSSEGKSIEASLVSITDTEISIKLAKGGKVHTLNLEKLSQADRDLITKNKEEASKIVELHNEKVRPYNWYTYWWRNSSFINNVPELEIDELLLIYHFGLVRDLNFFSVKFTPSKFRIANDKLTAIVMGDEGFAINVKTGDGWTFTQSGDKLSVRPKSIEQGSSDRIEIAYTGGVTERLLFPNGRSISFGEFGISNCLTLSMENFEPRRK